eukprot:COSAG05_NODE_160_length_15590_cov_14.460848_12_plen_102_part_00
MTANESVALSNAHYSCSCSSGYAGPRCEIPIAAPTPVPEPPPIDMWPPIVLPPEPVPEPTAQQQPVNPYPLAACAFSPRPYSAFSHLPVDFMVCLELAGDG